MNSEIPKSKSFISNQSKNDSKRKELNTRNIKSGNFHNFQFLNSNFSKRGIMNSMNIYATNQCIKENLRNIKVAVSKSTKPE